MQKLHALGPLVMSRSTFQVAALCARDQTLQTVGQTVVPLFVECTFLAPLLERYAGEAPLHELDLVRRRKKHRVVADRSYG